MNTIAYYLNKIIFFKNQLKLYLLARNIPVINYNKFNDLIGFIYTIVSNPSGTTSINDIAFTGWNLTQEEYDDMVSHLTITNLTHDVTALWAYSSTLERVCLKDLGYNTTTNYIYRSLSMCRESPNITYVDISDVKFTPQNSSGSNPPFDNSYMFPPNVVTIDMSNIIYNSNFFKQSGSSTYDMFREKKSLKNIIGLDTIQPLDANVTSQFNGMFASCTSLEQIDFGVVNDHNVLYLSSMFSQCTSLTYVRLKAHNINNFDSMFSLCTNLTNFDLYLTSSSSGANMYGMFWLCNSIVTIDLSNCNIKATNINQFAGNCSNLVTVDMHTIDLSLTTNVGQPFGYTSSSYYSRNLENVSFGTNLGAGFTQKTSNYNNYTLSLQYNNNLTVASLNDIISKLYDLNLTYDVAGGGTLYTQKLVLGTTNINKLTAQEIAIATNKGWTVS